MKITLKLLFLGFWLLAVVSAISVVLTAATPGVAAIGAGMLLIAAVLFVRGWMKGRAR